MHVNNHKIVGNLGADPTIINFKNGRQGAKLSVATTETIQRSSGKTEERTQWHQVDVFGEAVAYVEANLKKGMAVSIEGGHEYQQIKVKDAAGEPVLTAEGEQLFSTYSFIKIADGRGSILLDGDEPPF